MGSYRINRDQLMKELKVANPTFQDEATKQMEVYFDQAVDQLKSDFDNDPVTREIAGGIDAPNYSNTLQGFPKADDNNSPANLTSFIGFSESPDKILEPIVTRLSPDDKDGPKMQYVSSDSGKLIYNFLVTAPKVETIYDHTPMPDWEGGVSWAKRVQESIPGALAFLNKRGKGRSTGGIQVNGDLNKNEKSSREKFQPVDSYLPALFEKFVQNFLTFAFSQKGQRYYNVRSKRGRFTKK